MGWEERMEDWRRQRSKVGGGDATRRTGSRETRWVSGGRQVDRRGRGSRQGTGEGARPDERGTGSQVQSQGTATGVGEREIGWARGRWASVWRKTQGRGRGRGGALATSEVDGGPGARPVLR